LGVPVIVRLAAACGAAVRTLLAPAAACLQLALRLPDHADLLLLHLRDALLAAVERRVIGACMV
jgi:hypothetical protein